MKSTEVAGVKIYDLSSGKLFPSFLSEKMRKKFKSDVEFSRRIELLQDFNFKTFSTCVKVCDDNRYIVAGGGYPPQVKVFDVKELSMKFEHHVDAEIVAMEVLSEDYSKLCFLSADRTLSFHAKYGHHYSTRIPAYGRAMCYDGETGDLYVASCAPEIYRLNLSEGRFREPWVTSQEDSSSSSSSDRRRRAGGSGPSGAEDAFTGNNDLDISPGYRLVAAAGADGVVRCFDTRARREVPRVCQLPKHEDERVSAMRVRFDRTAEGGVGGASSDTGMTFAVGDSVGRVFVYDLRSTKPLSMKRHPYGLPIVSLDFARGGRRERLVLSSDAKQVKCWNADVPDRNLFTIETPAKITGVCVAPVGSGGAGLSPGNDDEVDAASRPRTSGLIFVSGDQERVMTYYIPKLGPAPVWAGFLDSLTEELEEESLAALKRGLVGGEDPTSSSSSSGAEGLVYDDYRFITREQVEELQLSHLLGTSALRPWMHGYFMEAQAYEKVRAALRPSAFAEWRKQRVNDLLEKKRAERVVLSAAPSTRGDERRGKAGKARVNAALAAENEALATDDRFGALFEDPAFAVNEESSEFRQMFPSGRRARNRADEDSDHEDEEEEEDAPIGKKLKTTSTTTTTKRHEREDGAKSLTYFVQGVTGRGRSTATSTHHQRNSNNNNTKRGRGRGGRGRG